MINGIEKLKGLNKEKEFLVCIDSDGCAIDTMEIKHKQCFGPMMVDIWELEDISNDVLEVWNFVNLYSKWRGINRFKALLKVFQLLEKKKTVIDSGIDIPDSGSIRRWVESAKHLSNPALESVLMHIKDPVLEKTLIWSKGVNELIANMPNNHPPFMNVKETLAKMQKYADIVVVSSANAEALHKEWNLHGLTEYVKVIAGQEMGSKTACIEMAKADRYENDNVIMIGDAPGDHKAAEDNEVLYYPIITGKEKESWKILLEEAFGKFINGQFKGEYQEKLINEFNIALTSEIPWD